MRYQQARNTTFGRNCPDISTGNERNFARVGRQRRFGQRDTRNNLLSRQRYGIEAKGQNTEKDRRTQGHNRKS